MQSVIASILFLIILPFILVLIIIILIVDRQNPFFIQSRVGKMKINFKVYKIRTMKNGRITHLGKVLRKTGIDELLQLINIIKGSMNFVGPRPLTILDVSRLKWDSSSHVKRWSVKPGITGMAQLVNVCDANISWQNDMDYIKWRSVKLDLKIIWQSLLVPFIGKSRAKEHLNKVTA